MCVDTVAPYQSNSFFVAAMCDDRGSLMRRRLGVGRGLFYHDDVQVEMSLYDGIGRQPRVSCANPYRHGTLTWCYSESFIYGLQGEIFGLSCQCTLHGDARDKTGSSRLRTLVTPVRILWPLPVSQTQPSNMYIVSQDPPE